MKDFIKTTLAVLAAMIILSVVSSMMCLGIIGSLASLGGSSQPALPKTGVLTIDLSKTVIAEQSAQSNPLGSVTSGTEVAITGIWDAVQAINTAAQDPCVQYIFLKTDNSRTGLSHLSELRAALQNFRTTSGKPIVSYIENPTTGSYYMASVADKVYMTSHPGAIVNLGGISSQMFFLGDLLDRLGINMQLIRHGKYKSAGEMFIRNSPSPENREQNQVMVNSLWNSVAQEITESRSISVDKLNDLIDNLRLNLPQDFVDACLVDEILTREQLQERLATLALVDDYKDVKSIAFEDYAKAKIHSGKAHKKIAVVYADGDIVDGTDKKEVAGDRFCAILEKVRKDSTVKAVVLRVNSPGGAVLAADKIKHEVDLLGKEKPVVASYGEYAASGGYWISAGADKIFSDATTLTGSIGVFSIIPDYSKAAKDLAHVGVTSISSNSHGDIYSGMRPLDKDEYAYMLRSVEDVYDRFTAIVAQGRGMEVSEVDRIGQGRVWAGTDALAIGLVDEIGTLEDAIRYAAVCADDPELENWTVKGYPKPLSAMEEMLSMFNISVDGNEGALLQKFSCLTKGAQMQARIPFEIELKY